MSYDEQDAAIDEMYEQIGRELYWPALTTAL